MIKEDLKIEKLCVCKEWDLEQGDTLYYQTSWEGGIEYNYIENIKYCPICGKKLPEWKERKF